MSAVGELTSSSRPAGALSSSSKPGPRDGPTESGVSLLVDARGLHQSGIGRYLRSVLRYMLDDARFSRVSLLGDPSDLGEYLNRHARGSDIEIIPFAHGFYDPAAQAHWWRLALQGRLRCDVSFFPHYDVPLAPAVRNRVVTVQDLNHFRLPELFPRWKRALASNVLRAAVRGATRVLVSSQSTRRDLLERHPQVASKLEVIPLGVDASFADGFRAESVRGRRTSAWEPYLLCVGNRKPSKNLAAAVEALALLRDAGMDFRLLLAGQTFRESDDVTERAAALGVGGSVVELGEVTDAELRALYAGAECLLFPSLYEGFGLPVLEAMALGTPVIASDRASTPEVVGDAGLVVPPTGAALAEAVRRLREQPALRRGLIDRGSTRARALTWSSTAAATTEALLAASGSRRHERR